MLLHWLGVANHATLRASNLGYNNDSQQLGFCTKFFTDPMHDLPHSHCHTEKLSECYESTLFHIHLFLNLVNTPL